ncbi:hypothetical protein VTH06DRAFT_5724 [Thermothelomyces fergusii]
MSMHFKEQGKTRAKLKWHRVGDESVLGPVAQCNRSFLLVIREPTDLSIQFPVLVEKIRPKAGQKQPCRQR